MIFILGISKAITWKVQVLLLEVSLMIFILSDIQRYQMENGSGIARSISDELDSSDMQRDQMEG